MLLEEYCYIADISYINKQYWRQEAIELKDAIIADSRIREQDKKKVHSKIENLQEKLTDLGNISSSNGHTVINYLAEVTYDNELLNHPTLLSKLFKQVSPSKIIKLSSKLSKELLREAIINNDAELILAGLTSLTEANDLS